LLNGVGLNGLPFPFRGEPVTITFTAGLTELQEADDPVTQ